jgi:hypothetical protein
MASQVLRLIPNAACALGVTRHPVKQGIGYRLSGDRALAASHQPALLAEMHAQTHKAPLRSHMNDLRRAASQVAADREDVSSCAVSIAMPFFEPRRPLSPPLGLLEQASLFLDFDGPLVETAARPRCGDGENRLRDLWGKYPQTYSLFGLLNCAALLSRPW